MTLPVCPPGMSPPKIGFGPVQPPMRKHWQPRPLQPSSRRPVVRRRSGDRLGQWGRPNAKPAAETVNADDRDDDADDLHLRAVREAVSEDLVEPLLRQPAGVCDHSIDDIDP